MGGSCCGRTVDSAAPMRCRSRARPASPPDIPPVGVGPQCVSSVALSVNGQRPRSQWVDQRRCHFWCTVKVWPATEIVPDRRCGGVHPGSRGYHGPMAAPSFLFATGIENSCPTIGGRRVRVDEMEKWGTTTSGGETSPSCRRWAIRTLRYGPPFIAPGSARSATTGHLPTLPLPSFATATSCPLRSLPLRRSRLDRRDAMRSITTSTESDSMTTSGDL